MRIFIDADGSPVVNIAVQLAEEYSLEAIIVKNYAHQIHDEYATVVSVDIFPESADLYIINHIEDGDIVITQDYGLAALCLSKNTYPINQSGLVFTENNIDGLLNSRFIHRKLRDQGKHHSNPKKRKASEDTNFAVALEKLIEEKQ